MLTLKFTLFFIALLGINSIALAAGYKMVKTDDLQIAVFYPSDSPEKAKRLGPFDVQLSFNAPLSMHKKYQPILLSHGNNGRPRNHHLSAKALADAGFIVIAPLHTLDHLIGGDDGHKAIFAGRGGHGDRSEKRRRGG